MNNATLMYKIPYNDNYIALKLENRPLFLIDKITSSFKNDDDFISHYYKRDLINNFIHKYGDIKGSIAIDYKKDINDKKELMPLYNSKDSIVIIEDYYNDKISEMEKARKLLFNSKNQLFTKMLINSHIFDKELNKLIDLDDNEAKFAINNGIKTFFINGKYYIYFKTLLQYRINSTKLGVLRNVYQDMLDVFKKRINEKDRDSVYYYNRELRMLIDQYKEMTYNTMTVRNVKNYNNNKKVLKYSIKKV